jgi:futalosine hydrolase
MRVLIVAATEAEIGVLSAAPSAVTIDTLMTGVGMVATAARVARALAVAPPDLALNIGLCGAFDRARPLASVVQVVADELPEVGVEDGPVFRPATTVGLVAPDAFPYSRGRLHNAHPPASSALAALPAVSGITVNTVHGHDPSIALVSSRTAADVETMEGAAFMYACLTAGIPFAQIRAVSNHVERRNRDNWRIPDALDALGHSLRSILDDL